MTEFYKIHKDIHDVKGNFIDIKESEYEEDSTIKYYDELINKRRKEHVNSVALNYSLSVPLEELKLLAGCDKKRELELIEEAQLHVRNLQSVLDKLYVMFELNRKRKQ